MRGFIDGEYQDGDLRGITFVAGQRGMGKTTEMARLLSLCAGGVLFFDSLSRHEDVLPGYVMVHEPGPLKEYLKRNHQKRFRILYQPRAGNMDAHFAAVCVIVKVFGWMILGVDELDMLSGNRFGSIAMSPEFYHLVNYGRHSRLSMIATARDPVQVPRGFTSQCREMRLFRITEDRYVKYFESKIGAVNSNRLYTLKPYQFLLWQDGDETAKLCGGPR
jgi:hypothetical protein